MATQHFFNHIIPSFYKDISFITLLHGMRYIHFYSSQALLEFLYKAQYFMSFVHKTYFFNGAF